ncbi:hypothetical protein NIES4071_05650 [Calothrix sp. NIES-4071]|nr:hypothetical protein NIES4071_05650 [Calothrix sp. NIES-4071]BAZ54910.1 hypothetical protein NIES4105_05640 [Calothrix sp. NIES-4105]
MEESSPKNAVTRGLLQRFERRRTGRCGIINMRPLDSHLAPVPTWIVQRSALLEQLQKRYSSQENTNVQESELVLAAPAKPVPKQNSSLSISGKRPAFASAVVPTTTSDTSVLVQRKAVPIVEKKSNDNSNHTKTVPLSTKPSKQLPFQQITSTQNQSQAPTPELIVSNDIKHNSGFNQTNLFKTNQPQPQISTENPSIENPPVTNNLSDDKNNTAVASEIQSISQGTGSPEQLLILPKLSPENKSNINISSSPAQILTFHGILKTSPPTPLLQGEGGNYTPSSLVGNSVGGLGSTFIFPHNVKSQAQIEQPSSSNQLSQQSPELILPKSVSNDIQDNSGLNQINLFKTNQPQPQISIENPSIENSPVTNNLYDNKNNTVVAPEIQSISQSTNSREQLLILPKLIQQNKSTINLSSYPAQIQQPSSSNQLSQQSPKLILPKSVSNDIKHNSVINQTNLFKTNQPQPQISTKNPSRENSPLTNNLSDNQNDKVVAPEIQSISQGSLSPEQLLILPKLSPENKSTINLSSSPAQIQQPSSSNQLSQQSPKLILPRSVSNDIKYNSALNQTNLFNTNQPQPQISTENPSRENSPVTNNLSDDKNDTVVAPEIQSISQSTNSREQLLILPKISESSSNNITQLKSANAPSNITKEQSPIAFEVPHTSKKFLQLKQDFILTKPVSKKVEENSASNGENFSYVNLNVNRAVMAKEIPVAANSLHQQNIIWRKSFTTVHNVANNTSNSNFPIAINPVSADGYIVRKETQSNSNSNRTLDTVNTIAAENTQQKQTQTLGAVREVNVTQLAEHVSRILYRQLSIERERRGINLWY